MRRIAECSGIIILFLLVQAVIAGFYSIFSDLPEANAVAFLIMPGTISLLYLLLPREPLRWTCMVTSIFLTFIANQWHLVDGNKEWVFVAQCMLFIFCLAFSGTRHKKGYLVLASLLFAGCAAGVLGQTWLERQFHQANVCIVNDGGGCGASGRCFQYYAAKRCDTNAIIWDSLFDSEEYVNLWFSYSNSKPIVNFEGKNNKSAQYMLCGKSLHKVDEFGEIACN